MKNLIGSDDVAIVASQSLKEKTYWLNKLSGELQKITFPYDWKKTGKPEHRFNTIKFSLNDDLFSSLIKLGNNSDARLHMIMVAGLAVLLSKYKGTRDIIVGTSIYQQDIEANFVNTVLPLRFQLDDKMGFKHLLLQVRETIFEAVENQNYPYESLLNELNLKFSGDECPLFETAVLMENIQDKKYLKQVKPNITLVFLRTADSLEGKLEYNSRFYEKNTMERVITHFTRLLDKAVFNLELALSALDLLSPEEKYQLVHTFNNTEAAYPKESTIYELFEECANKLPHHTAVIHEDQRITYKELNERSNQLARIVKGKGIKPDSIAALLVDRSIEMMVGILGILKAGGAYLPIDTDSAENRIRFMLEDSGVKLLLTKKDAAKKAGADPGRETIFLDEIALYQGDNTNLEKINNPRDLVYMIYTSGTTGNPRGVMIEHQGLVNYIYWAAKTYVKHERLNFPLYTSISFDLTVTSVFTPLITGNSVVVYGSDDNFLLIEKIIDEQKVEVIKLTPSHLKLIKNKEIKNSPIKRLIVGGEELEVQLARDITGNFQENIEIFNEYGPTETVVGSMIYKFNRETDNRSSVPIGGPIDNTRVYVLDRNLKPVALGSIGEIYVSGHGVARGYFGDEALTTEKFIENPFIPGERMYRTGDMGRFQEDRNIDFLGRRDQQVKIRGFRVELGEIDSKLKNFKKIPFTTILDDDVAHISPIYKKNLRYCTRCLLSSDYPGINFDENGICNSCRQYDTFAQPLEKYFKQRDDFLRLVEQAREEKPGEYDCLLLFSGGKDSSYVLYQLVEMGIKVLTFTFDNGYISDTAFDNIKRITSELEVENVVETSPHMNKVFVESLKSNHNACHGCWNALNAVGTKIAHEKGINMIISGLSRGQIFDMRLQGLFQMGTFEEEEIEEKLVLFRKTFHSRNNKFARLLKVEIDENIIGKIYFVDFFRYFNASVEEIKTYLLKNGWVRPKDTGFCSSNCMINDVGIYIHLRERNYHFYSEQLSWDCRLGSITREQGLKEIDFEVDLANVDRILNEIGYFHSTPVKDAIVVDKEDKNGDKYLCAYLVSDDELSVSELREYLFGVLPGYMIPSYFLQIDKIPMTAHGKIDRRALPEIEFKSGRKYAAPRDNVEKKFVEIWSDILGIEKKIIGIDRLFFELGGHSLNATMMVSRIHKEFNVKISLVDIFRNPTIRGISEFIRKSKEDKFSSIKSVEKKDFYPLSSAQKRLYILQQFGTDNTGYNMPYVIPLGESFEKEKLESVFKKLIERHESLRTSFITVNEEPFQRIHREVDFSIGCYEVREEAGANSPISDFIKPFNLDTTPLLRVNLISVGSSRRVLFIDMHHIITDGISEDILEKEFLALHEGKYLLPLRVQYKDFAQWQNGEKEKKNLKRQEEYWLKEFEGEIPVLELPTDYPRPKEQSFEGDSLNFKITGEEVQALEAVALTGGTTLFMALVAVFNILLFKLSGQEEIIIGTPIAGRRHTDLDKIIGMFVNTLVLRNYPVGDRRFRDFLGEVKERMLTVFENQEYPFEELVDKLAVKRDIGRNPLFDIMFVLQNMYTSSAGQDKETEIENSRLFQLDSPNEYENIVRTAKFDLTLIAVEIDSGLFLSFEYCTKLFKKETIERFVIYFKKIVSIVMNDPGIKLDEIIVISEEEKNRLLYDFNNTETDYPKDKTINQLFEEQVEMTPDHTVLVGSKEEVSKQGSKEARKEGETFGLFVNAFSRGHLSYRKLNSMANQLAHLLIEKGVKADTIVGIMVDRSVEMVAGILGILISGGAYMPIDSEYPEERINYMLLDSRVGVLVTTPKLQVKVKERSVKLRGVPLQTINIEKDIFYFYKSAPSTSTCQVSPMTLAYVIYTSGTTGKPKGAMIEHRNVVRLLFTDNKLFDFNSRDVWTMFHSYCFDFSVWEMYGALLYGGKLVIISKMTTRDTPRYLDILKKEKVTILNQTPTAFYNLAHHEIETSTKKLTLKYVIFGGEALHPIKLKKWKEKYPQTKLVNMFGITETTVHVTYKELKDEDLQLNISNIGQPIPTLSTYVLDRNLKLVPIGTVGELCVGGQGVCRGYLNRPELTAEKFVENPYMEDDKLYRSGDLGKLSREGELEYLGRIDHQVKVRGHRVELGEIENHLLQHLMVKVAVVIAREDETNTNTLVGYIVPDPENAFPVKRFVELERKGCLDNRLWHEYPNGMKIFYINRNETDFMYREIFEEQTYIKHGITLDEGACIVDVGANIGMFSLFVSHLGSSTKIFAFEPLPPVFEVLSLNTSIYCRNIEIFPYGLSEKESDAVFTYYPHATVLSGRFADKSQETKTVKSFIKNEQLTGADEIPLTDGEINNLLENRMETTSFKCKMKTLSQFIREKGINKIDLLKIDVEKGEIDVLNGIDMGDWAKIRQLVIEVHDIDGRLKEIVKRLHQIGYRVTVDQDHDLKNTDLYNVYAKLPGGKPAAAPQAIEDLSLEYPLPGGFNPGRFIDDLRNFLKEKLPGYMVPSYFILLEQIPLTVNGKLDRKALPAPGIRAEEMGAIMAPGNKIEEKLVEIWSEILRIETDKIGIDKNFFDLGGHSLKATILVSKIHKEFEVRVPLAEIFKAPRIKALAGYIKGRSKDIYMSIKSVEKKEYYPLSSAQKRLYILQQMQLDSTAYNMPELIPLEMDSDIAKIEETFKKLIARHENFHTSLYMVNDEPVQRIHDEVEFEIEYYNLFPEYTDYPDYPDDPGKKKIGPRDFIRPFDLSKAPLLRVGVVEPTGGGTGTQNWHGHALLMVDMHHIISDGVSHEILVKDFMRSHEGEELPSLRIQYKDFSKWQNSESQKKAIKEQEEYWLKQFEGEVPVLNLPLDYTRPAVQSFEGAELSFELPVETTRALNQLAMHTGATLYMVLLAIYNILLSKLSGQEDIVVGIPIAARRHVDLERIIGMFVNTLAMRNYPEGNKKFIDFLLELKKNNLEAYENQEYQFEDLVEKVLTHRDIDRNPLFDTLLALQNMETQSNEIPLADLSSLTIIPYEIETGISKFDLELTFYESKGELLGSFGYCTQLFKKETIQRLAKYFLQAVSAVIEDRKKRLCQVEIITEEEKRQILYDFNDTASPFPKKKTIHRLFEEQVERKLDHVALVGAKIQNTNYKQSGVLQAKVNAFGGLTAHDECTGLPVQPVRHVYLTYHELDEKSSRLAHVLMEKDVRPDTIVGIMMERSVDMIIGILGILKAGGAYLPIDPGYPEERIQYMLADSGAKVLLSETSNFNCPLPIVNCQLLMVNEKSTTGRRLNNPPKEANLINNYQSTINNLQLKGNNLAYIIYTSGTTGKPKGVMIEASNVIKLVKNPNYIKFTEGERLLITGSIGFDITTFEIWGPLLNGLSLYLADGSTITDAKRLKEVITANRISLLHLIPQLFNQMAAEDIAIFAGLKYFLVGGDMVNPFYVNRLREKYRELTILHMYGPTEGTTFSTFLPIKGSYEDRIPIGKPVSNSTVYIIGKGNELLPIGAVGELVIGGEGIARGYLNQPELTSEKFKIINYKLKIQNGSGALRADFNAFGDGESYELARTIIKQKLLQGSRGRFSRKEPPGRRRLYKTGDFARWLPDGNIEFLGRIDNQVKLRGIRIELGEIERRLLAHPGIKEVLVQMLPGGAESGDKDLCAYITADKEISVSEMRESLSKSLPGYMIPSYFVFLERIPLNPNGKVDRKALPLPGVKAGAVYTAPRNEIEKKLMAIWIEVLGRDAQQVSQLETSLGIDDNFFELGGHSLKAAGVISRVNNEFKANVPLVELFKTPYIRKLAEYIQQAVNNSFTAPSKDNRDNNLLLLRENPGSVGNLFFLHDGTGEVEGYIDFCVHLEAGCNYWGIRANRLDNYTPRNLSIKDAAAAYIEKIKALQPSGPYSLTGWSLGGLIAFEIALQLEQRGEAILFLGLIDAPPPPTNFKERREEFSRESEIKWIKHYLPDEKIKEKLGQVSQIHEIWPTIINHLEENNFDIESIKRLIPGPLAQIIPNYNRLTIRELIYYLNMDRTLTLSQAYYIPSKKVHTPLHYFKASESSPVFRDCWQDYCIKPIKSFEITGDHFSILKIPNVYPMIKIIEKILKKYNNNL